MARPAEQEFSPAPGVFTVPVPVRFSHSDPAGIVYYPNYFDMFNALVEDWFTDHLGIDYARLVLENRYGLPTVHASCDFLAPSRMGEKLNLSLILRDIGRTSFRLGIVGHVAGARRLEATVVIVLIALDSGRPLPLPPELRQPLERYRAGAS